MEYPYFRGLEADRYSFYRVPKALVKADLFQKMSGDAKLLYAVLLDRMSLSIKNGWQDKHGNAYIICTIEEVMDSIHCARQKAVKLLDELEQEFRLMDKKKQRGKGEKSQCKKTGRQSIKSLQKSGAQITNIVVTDNNIKSFDRVARKYGIDYSLKKVEQEGKTEYLVFFKAKDVDVMTAAFKEYTSETLKKQKRESVRQKLEKVKEELSNHRQLKKEKKREQEPTR